MIIFLYAIIDSHYCETNNKLLQEKFRKAFPCMQGTIETKFFELQQVDLESIRQPVSIAKDLEFQQYVQVLYSQAKNEKFYDANYNQSFKTKTEEKICSHKINGPLYCSKNILNEKYKGLLSKAVDSYKQNPSFEAMADNALFFNGDTKKFMETFQNICTRLSQPMVRTNVLSMLTSTNPKALQLKDNLLTKDELVKIDNYMSEHAILFNYVNPGFKFDVELKNCLNNPNQKIDFLSPRKNPRISNKFDLKGGTDIGGIAYGCFMDEIHQNFSEYGLNMSKIKTISQIDGCLFDDNFYKKYLYSMTSHIDKLQKLTLSDAQISSVLKMWCQAHRCLNVDKQVENTLEVAGWAVFIASLILTDGASATTLTYTTMGLGVLNVLHKSPEQEFLKNVYLNDLLSSSTDLKQLASSVESFVKNQAELDMRTKNILTILSGPLVDKIVGKTHGVAVGAIEEAVKKISIEKYVKIVQQIDPTRQIDPNSLLRSLETGILSGSERVLYLTSYMSSLSRELYKSSFKESFLGEDTSIDLDNEYIFGSLLGLSKLLVKKKYDNKINKLMEGIVLSSIDKMASVIKKGQNPQDDPVFALIESQIKEITKLAQDLSMKATEANSPQVKKIEKIIQSLNASLATIK